eukprot:jgi/Botrbrau1/1306/Bobra.0063s0023.1
MVAPSEGAEHIKDEVARAVSLLKILTQNDPPEHPYGTVNPKALFKSKGLLFYHTRKVGLGIGFKWGSGILIAHLQDEEGRVSWSAPCLFKIKEASFGLLAGAGSVQTLLLLGSKKALEQVTKGQPTIGNDFKVVAGNKVDNISEDAGASEHNDAICYSLADGAMVDFTINGGKISVDTDANVALYGPGITPEQILTTSASNSPVSLPGVSELYEALQLVTDGARADPRKFAGFETVWKPTNLLPPAPTAFQKLKE